ncbi:putative signal transducing protein [Ruminiclostridium cellobioparum]|uniref:DUF2007 domain-containing protein n=1 Tax=Ruminiclostridium cellobioparum subsp. termitidis CT1112 TaxID=1195236 RepID=S0FGB4_RUMCE|nr:DUF2007 domain-containing protein [Ruminiclostridium cellobioparum]EMS70007.1 hypothetical protein CTER_4236 [Ruminiclostridium cellobioparum subsp. termitidis CT1112]
MKRLFNLNKKNNEQENRSGPEGWVHLTTTENEFEYNVVSGLLKENGITCIGKGKPLDLMDSGFLNIVLGPCIPVDIMVPSELYEEAHQILNSQVSDEEIEKQAICEEQEKNEE